MLDNLLLKNKLDRPFLNGMWADLWAKHIDIIQEVIKVQKLSATDIHNLPGPGLSHILSQPYATSLTSRDTSKALYLTPIHKIPFPGGIRIPHLHFNGDVYILNDKQWADFSGKILSNLKDKLSKVNTVNVEKLTEISTAIDSM